MHMHALPAVRPCGTVKGNVKMEREDSVSVPCTDVIFAIQNSMRNASREVKSLIWADLAALRPTL
jgi:hypothetical protein